MSYTVDGNPVLEQAEVNNFPADLFNWRVATPPTSRNLEGCRAYGLIRLLRLTLKRFLLIVVTLSSYTLLLFVLLSNVTFLRLNVRALKHVVRFVIFTISYKFVKGYINVTCKLKRDKILSICIWENKTKQRENFGCYIRALNGCGWSLPHGTIECHRDYVFYFNVQRIQCSINAPAWLGANYCLLNSLSILYIKKYNVHIFTRNIIKTLMR